MNKIKCLKTPVLYFIYCASWLCFIDSIFMKMKIIYVVTLTVSLVHYFSNTNSITNNSSSNTTSTRDFKENENTNIKLNHAKVLKTQSTYLYKPSILEWKVIKLLKYLQRR